MIKTPLGNFSIYFGNKKLDYTSVEVKNTFGLFSVEKRFDVFCNKSEYIDLKVEGSNFIESFDSDESYSVVLYENGEYIVGIGVDGAYPDLICEHSENNFCIKKNMNEKLKIRLVWTKKDSENPELACWYGADPNYE